MDKIVAGDTETLSADSIADNIEKLKALFPEAFTEGKVDFEVLRQILGDAVEAGEEKYGLNWHGKRRSRQLALTPSTATLRPCPEESVNWDSTKNLMIEGENLEVLKLLQKSYAGKVKLIYIDPPYNTGKDFIYPDNSRQSIQNYLEITGQIDNENHSLSSNPETSGRFHTNWLNMMYPRLKIARDLLRPDGALLCHMDENEQAGLEQIIEETFGFKNLLGMIVWDKRNPKGDATGVSYQHEVLFLVAKDRQAFGLATQLERPKANAARILSKANELFSRIGTKSLPAELAQCAKRFRLPRTLLKQYERETNLSHINKEFAEWSKGQDLSGGESAYDKIDEQGNVFQSVSMAWPNKKEAPADYFKPLKHPVTGLDCPVPKRGWRNPPATMRVLEQNGEIIYGKDHTTQPRRKYLLKANLSENFPSIFSYGASDDALLQSLGIPFDTVKPVEVARKLIAATTDAKSIVMDFFAGSGTVGHALALQNVADGGERRYILVQLPEPIDDKEQKRAAEFCDALSRPRNIAEITKERLRRAAEKIKTDAPDYQGDLGFRVFRLDTSNIRAWNPRPDDLDDALLSSLDHIEPERSKQDILYELLLKLGFDLCAPIETRVIAGKSVHWVGDGGLIASLDEAISNDEAVTLAAGIADWRDDIAPAGETTVIFRDSAFANDVAKTNLAETLKQRGLGNLRSL